MAEISQGDIASILELTRKPLAAETGEEFFSAVRNSFDSLKTALLGAKNSRHMLRALELALRQCKGARQRRVLDVFSCPIFDKPAVPAGDPEAIPEFLWIFCLPFVVQFSENAVKEPIALPQEMFDGRAVLRAGINQGYYNEQALLSGFPTLLTRDDLHHFGPSHLATTFIKAELDGGAGLEPRSRQLDSEVESGRVETYYMICAARLTVGEKQLFNRSAAWPAEQLANLVKAGFSKNGIEVEDVQSLPATSLTEGLFRCTVAGAAEMRRVLFLGKEHYGITSVKLLQAMEGMADLTGIDEAGEEFVLRSSFSFVEPWSEIKHLVEDACHDQGLAFMSASLGIPTSSMTH